MRLRKGWILAMSMAVLAACRPLAQPTTESAFRNLQHVSISDAAALPKGDLRLNAYVVDVGSTNSGTYLALTDSPDDSQRMTLVYGSSADALFAQYVKGQRADIEFSVIGRTKLPDGSKALRINLTGMRVAAPATPNAR
ncbi:MAG TPA: hypothetical protein VL403_09055 [Candidatus Kryptonia bacterium]|nr:hypothetical protein [Candidatus Kryptonia bacterium]